MGLLLCSGYGPKPWKYTAGNKSQKVPETWASQLRGKSKALQSEELELQISIALLFPAGWPAVSYFISLEFPFPLFVKEWSYSPFRGVLKIWVLTCLLRRKCSITLIYLFLFFGVIVVLPRGQHTGGLVLPGRGLASPTAETPIGFGTLFHRESQKHSTSLDCSLYIPQFQIVFLIF